ncbi:PREDICTED: E3 ubiquitin-protein ligase RNF4-like [Corvus brachyrhynchos]|uniref:E3 ubiquitin-protein ligase RNF4-like n=1 Tax=Corvus brachyrhynchos TaxID=85066 RepID=UPI0008165440|nr:PREDICTED: E3 ubiquitin-protein ligase RNF4-like [Corvus brachyrhynchos]
MRNQRKRRGEADDFGQAQKRSRLLASSTGEASEPEPADLEESGTLSFELAGEEFIGVTADSPESEDINLTGNDFGNVVQGEQNEQHPLVSRAVDELIVLLASVDDVESSSSRDSDDGSPPRDTGSSPRGSDDGSPPRDMGSSPRDSDGYVRDKVYL